MFQPIYHPEYMALATSWEKYQNAWDGGKDFVTKYVTRNAVRETTEDYTTRLNISYCCSHAAAAVQDVQNAIYQRLTDIIRNGGSVPYQRAVRGENLGVDRRSHSMTDFLGREVLPQLLIKGKVGVLVDRARLDDSLPLSETTNQSPYLQVFRAENIVSWAYDSVNRLSSVLLHEWTNDIDEDTGLVKGYIESWRVIQVTQDGVRVTVNHKDGEPETLLLPNLRRLPFVVVDIGKSLMTDIADLQVALTNLASADMNYCIRSGFPLYTEQYAPLADVEQVLRMTAPDGTGTAAEAQTSADRKLVVSGTQGRRYPQGVERPDFIHPSAEPLNASMEKQEAIKRDIRQLVNLALTNIDPKRASAESKSYDQQGLEAGLSFIGLALQHCEVCIANIWADYEGEEFEGTITYPSNYSLRTTKDRLDEAEALSNQAKSLTSLTAQRILAKRRADLLLGASVTQAERDKVASEIDSAAVVINDPEIVQQDIEAGLVSISTASQLRGYAPGEYKQAQIDHANRLARIAIAQSQGAAAARGLPDASAAPKADAESEKQ